MKIAAKFKLNTFFSICMIILIGITEFIAFKNINSVFQKISHVDQIVSNAFELNLLTYEYLMGYSERVYIQWYSKYDIFSKHIENTGFYNIKEKHLLNEIKQNHENMNALFQMLVKMWLER